MISAEYELLLLILFLFTMITLAACRDGGLLSVAIATCMICSGMLGQAVMVWPGIMINTAGLYSTVALVGIGMQFMTCGVEAAYKTISNNLFALAITLGSMFMLEQALMLSPLFESRIVVAGARFGSCYLVQSLLVYVLNRVRAARSVGKFLATGLLTQLIDVLVFFPSAFGGIRSLDLISEYALAGLAMRTSVMLLATPFLTLLVWLIRKGWVPSQRHQDAGEIAA